MSKKDLLLYCFDPGATTGIAVLRLSPQPQGDRYPFLLRSFDLSQVGNILTDKLSNRVVGELLTDMLPQDSFMGKIIIERVRTAHPSIDQTGVSVMGGLQALVYDRLLTKYTDPADPLLQAPQNKEAAKKWPVGAKLLDELKYRSTEHQRDALLHGIYYLVVTKLIDPTLTFSLSTESGLSEWHCTSVLKGNRLEGGVG